MPLVFARNGQTISIKRILGNDSARRHLGELGFVPGELVTIVNRMEDSLVVSVKGARVALDARTGSRIIV